MDPAERAHLLAGPPGAPPAPRCSQCGHCTGAVRAELVQYAAGVTIALVWKYYFQGVEERNHLRHSWVVGTALIIGGVGSVQLHQIQKRFVGRRRRSAVHAAAECGRLTFVVFAAVSTLTWLLRHLNKDYSPKHANALAALCMFLVAVPLVAMLAHLLPAPPERHGDSHPLLGSRSLLEDQSPQGGAPRGGAAFAEISTEDDTQVWVDSATVTLLRFAVSTFAVACAWAGEYSLEQVLEDWDGDGHAADWAFSMVTPAALLALYAYQRLAGVRYRLASPHGRAVYREGLSLAMEVLPHLIAFAWFGVFLSFFDEYHGLSAFEDKDPCWHRHRLLRNPAASSSDSGNGTNGTGFAVHALESVGGHGGRAPKCDPYRHDLIWLGAGISLIIFPWWMSLINCRVARDEDKGTLCCGCGVPIAGLPHAMSWHHTVQHFFSHTLGLAMGFSWTAAIGQEIRWAETDVWYQLPAAMLITVVGCFMMAVAAWSLLKSDDERAGPAPGAPV
eukprot:TRINITY_DN34610_c0_g1_i1.p1 TRINITY_DN34610_c0_g1~~TRINITY_DN34610_c0_g1_i1.p1  ORF type:complete len:527 (+),score=93.51 TRINITY_DN34610_c0_g1_i1:75-1583(+)